MANMMTVYMAGMGHHVPDVAAQKALHTEGDEVLLVPEPDNKFDENAIKLLWINPNEPGEPGVMVGYVPRKDTGPIHAFLKEGITVTGRIKETGRSLVELSANLDNENDTGESILGEHFNEDEAREEHLGQSGEGDSRTTTPEG